MTRRHQLSTKITSEFFMRTLDVTLQLFDNLATMRTWGVRQLVHVHQFHMVGNAGALEHLAANF